VPSSPCNATFELSTVDVLIYDYKINYKKLTLLSMVFGNNEKEYCMAVYRLVNNYKYI